PTSPLFPYTTLFRSGLETTWGYYPAKFGWTVSILLLVIAVGAAASLIAEFSTKKRTDAIAAGFGVVLLTGLLWSPSEPQGPLEQDRKSTRLNSSHVK